MDAAPLDSFDAGWHKMAKSQLGKLQARNRVHVNGTGVVGHGDELGTELGTDLGTELGTELGTDLGTPGSGGETPYSGDSANAHAAPRQLTYGGDGDGDGEGAAGCGARNCSPNPKPPHRLSVDATSVVGAPSEDEQAMELISLYQKGKPSRSSSAGRNDNPLPAGVMLRECRRLGIGPVQSASLVIHAAPEPCTLKPHTLQSETLNPKPETVNPKP